MKEHPNFYENMDEAKARLWMTIVLYDDIPYQVMAITDHMVSKDGIFRTWLCPVGIDKRLSKPFYDVVHNYGGHMQNSVGPLLDEMLKSRPKAGILRKHMNSPKFNRFRPFPLGMCNVGHQTFYVERQPIRPSMHQGLTKNGCFETLITAGSRTSNPRHTAEYFDVMAPHFKDCVLADHHTAEEVLDALLNPRVANDSHAFHREFALVRGPMEMIFLAYQTDIIGLLVNNDFSSLKLGKEFSHCREVVQELGLFHKVY